MVPHTSRCVGVCGGLRPIGFVFVPSQVALQQAVNPAGQTNPCLYTPMLPGDTTVEFNGFCIVSMIQSQILRPMRRGAQGHFRIQKWRRKCNRAGGGAYYATCIRCDCVRCGELLVFCIFWILANLYVLHNLQNICVFFLYHESPCKMCILCVTSKFCKLLSKMISQGNCSSPIILIIPKRPEAANTSIFYTKFLFAAVVA